MRRQDFHYELPPGLIAQRPPERRGTSRLLVLPGDGTLQDAQMGDFPGLLAPADLLVFNDTRVIPARLYGEKQTGGRVEILVERLLDERSLLAQVRASKSPKPGSRIAIPGAGELEVLGREDEFFHLRLVGEGSAGALLEKAGHMPLPPYVERPDDAVDRERYQTVYARRPGAVAAPTAGLHFDESMLDSIRAKGVAVEFVTLHVGAGTFQPMRVENVDEHKMHQERYEVGDSVVQAVARCRAAGGRVVAVGTTVVRTLESACVEGELVAGSAETRLFITPGYRFRVVDAMLTNFHLPESTLLMLVCAFGGQQRVMDAYRHAVDREYRFFSYGDAMFIPRRAKEG